MDLLQTPDSKKKLPLIFALSAIGQGLFSVFG
jgi:hypothetical protein